MSPPPDHRIRGMTKGASTWLLFAVFAFAFQTSASGQVIQLSGGTSTLSDSSGGTLTVRGQSYTSSFGAGTIEGHAFAGAQLVKSTAKATFTLGTHSLPFNLPTDIFDSNHYLTGLGAGVTARIGDARLRGFFGETSTQFDSPFFTGATGGVTSALFSFTGNVTSTVTDSVNTLVSNKVSMINSVAWTPRVGPRMAVSVGMGSNQPYGAVSLVLKRSTLDLKAAYYAAGSQFRRADVQTPLTSEADKENILVNFYVSPRLTLTAGRQNYLSPVYGTDQNLRSTVNQASAFYLADGYVMSMSLLQSSYDGSRDISMTGSIAKQFSNRLNIQQTFLGSKPDHTNGTSALITTIQEDLNPRWTLSQTINSSSGNHSVGFGGSFLSNLSTLSAEYQTYYVPTNPAKPFEQALILNGRVHAIDRLTLDGSTFVSPTGKLLYTVSAESELSRERLPSAEPFERHAIGRMTLRGRVLDLSGQPVMGAAILFDEMRVYSDSDGYFYLSEQKVRWHAVKVLGDQFLDGYHYRVISAPVTVRTSPSETQRDTTVVVEKIVPENRGLEKRK
jgi:hypothetical protein